MPIPLIAAELAPIAIKLGANLLHKNKPSEYEQKLSGLADIYKEQSQAPIDQNRIFQEGKKQLDQRDQQNRNAINRNAAATGATNEAKLAQKENSNEAYGQALSRLFNTAQNYRQNMQTRYLNALGHKQQARNNREANFQRKLNNIVKPVSQAANAFTLSQLYSEPTGGSSDNSDGVISYLDKQYQPDNPLNPQILRT